MPCVQKCFATLACDMHWSVLILHLLLVPKIIFCNVQHETFG